MRIHEPFQFDSKGWLAYTAALSPLARGILIDLVVSCPPGGMIYYKESASSPLRCAKDALESAINELRHLDLIEVEDVYDDECEGEMPYLRVMASFGQKVSPWCHQIKDNPTNMSSPEFGPE